MHHGGSDFVHVILFRLREAQNVEGSLTLKYVNIKLDNEKRTTRQKNWKLNYISGQHLFRVIYSRNCSFSLRDVMVVENIVAQ